MENIEIKKDNPVAKIGVITNIKQLNKLKLLLFTGEDIGSFIIAISYQSPLPVIESDIISSLSKFIIKSISVSLKKLLYNLHG